MTTAAQTRPRGIEVHADAARTPAPAAPPAPPLADPSSWSQYFEEIYRDAGGNSVQVPWADRGPNPSLQAWLNADAPGLIRPGATVVVVGCGLGQDVRELAGRGYDTLGFDVSPTGIAWARQRHPDLSDRLMVADLFALPPSIVRRADLVVEINTLQALHPELRPQAAGAIVSLARPRGTVLAICRGRDTGDPLPENPPFPLSAQELTDLMGTHGLVPVRAVDDFMDDETPPVRRLRGAFRRG